MTIRLYPKAEVWAWLALSSTGVAMSLLSLHELRAGMEAIRKVALGRPHAQDIIQMSEHNQLSEFGRLIAQISFFVLGAAALFSKPPVVLSRPRVMQRALPWVLVLAEGILVSNSVNEYVVSQRILKRRASVQREDLLK